MALSRVATSLIASSVLVLSVNRASAQSPAKFGLQAGGSVPVSSYGSDKHAGYHLGILVDLRMGVPVLGFRIEGAYHELKYAGNTTRDQIWTADADAELKIPTGTPAIPYAIGGIGIYSSHRSLFLSTGYNTNPGVNLGGGLRFELGEATAFVEARYERTFRSDPLRLVPITVGLLF
jgi:hypothetical protein